MAMPVATESSFNGATLETPMNGTGGLLLCCVLRPLLANLAAMARDEFVDAPYVGGERPSAMTTITLPCLHYNFARAVFPHHSRSLCVDAIFLSGFADLCDHSDVAVAYSDVCVVVAGSLWVSCQDHVC